MGSVVCRGSAGVSVSSAGTPPNDENAPRSWSLRSLREQNFQWGSPIQYVAFFAIMCVRQHSSR